MLKVSHLTKTFGNVVAVNDVSFEVPQGSIMGIIGQNGSGKTTLFRLILDFITPEGGGQVSWKGQPMDRSIENQVGYLPEDRGLYEDISIEDQIILFGELRGMKAKDIASKIDDWMERFNVKGERTDKIKTLSKGNQQKVQVIATLIHEPDLVILDEPFSGLDPVNADLLKQGILGLRDQGSCIIFSSHNMRNVEEICDSLLMIHHGEQVLYGPVQEVKNSFGRVRLIIEAPGWTRNRLEALEGVVEVRRSDDGESSFEVILEDESYGPKIFDLITEGNYVPQFSQVTPSLEEIFKWKAGESLE